jgi:hypothetical protein
VQHGVFSSRLAAVRAGAHVMSSAVPCRMCRHCGLRTHTNLNPQRKPLSPGPAPESAAVAPRTQKNGTACSASARGAQGTRLVLREKHERFVRIDPVFLLHER